LAITEHAQGVLHGTFFIRDGVVICRHQ
jgi:hypothetical protein